MLPPKTSQIIYQVVYSFHFHWFVTYDSCNLHLVACKVWLCTVMFVDICTCNLYMHQKCSIEKKILIQIHANSTIIGYRNSITLPMYYINLQFKSFLFSWKECWLNCALCKTNVRVEGDLKSYFLVLTNCIMYSATCIVLKR